MAYKQFDPAHPDPDDDNGAEVCSAIRDNDSALCDGVLLGIMAGFRREAHGDDLALPDYWLVKKGDVWLRITPTRDDDGEITSSLYEKSIDGGQNWETIGTLAITRDEQGNFSYSDWS